MYEKICSFILLFNAFSLVAQPYDAIINLGGDCQVAYQLHVHGLRQYALPFDGFITPFYALYNMVLYDFDGFLEPDNFELAIDSNNNKYILDKKYGIGLLHDFKLEEDFLSGYAVFVEKYGRRIDRFRNLMIESHYPLFIRKRITKEQAVKLRDLIVDLRQGRPFLLVALDNTDEIRSDWQLDLVVNYYLQQPKPYVWKGDTQAWKEIFDNLGLLAVVKEPID